MLLLVVEKEEEVAGRDKEVKKHIVLDFLDEFS